MQAENRYTFGDSDPASVRLRDLALAYAAPTTELLLACGVVRPALAVDLGCGPGWTTSLLHRVVRSSRTLGLDRSARFVAEATRRREPGTEFAVWDVAEGLPPDQSPALLLCRFLLTHLRDPRRALAGWARGAAPTARLAVFEIASLDSDHPALARYYALVGELQAGYGQDLRIGLAFDSLVPGSGWEIQSSALRLLEQPAPVMAGLHLANLRTWRQDPLARERFDPAELAALEGALERLQNGTDDAAGVRTHVRQAVLRRE